MHTHPKLYPATILATAFILSLFSPVVAQSRAPNGEEHNVLITAYYSPLPDQEHFAMGSYEEDIAFNGYGIAGNDGTRVYPGMIAAPQEIAFGSRIALPTIGVVGTVHDRGGWIEMMEDGTMRLDLWMGHGEEGLARALEWGAQRMQAVIYPPDQADRTPETFTLTQFPAPASALKHLPANSINLLGIADPEYGDVSVGVAAVQHTLQKLGYLDHDITWYFGDATRDALQRFQRDMQISVNGTRADERTRKALLAQRNITTEIGSPLVFSTEEILHRGSSGKEVRIAQRLLTLLQKYDGAIDGSFDAALQKAVLAFQRERSIVQSPSEAGAGMIGPQTRRALLTAWRQYRVEKRERGEMMAGRVNNT